MSTNRSRRIDRATAEQLLDGAGAGAAPGHDALAGLLAAVSAPAGDGELAGEQAAMAAFRSARLAPVSDGSSAVVAAPRKRKLRTPAMLLGAKVAATVAAAALGGVAVAAGTGNLPAALGGKPESSAPARAASAPSLDAAEPTPRKLAGSPEAVPAELAELCRAYAANGGGAQPAPAPSEVLSEPRFAPLVAAAGGPAGVPGYCAPVVGGQGTTPGGSPAPRPTEDRRGASPKPGKSGKPEATKRPGDPAPTRTSGGPGGPGGRPTDRPDTGPTPPQPRNDAPTTRPTP
ncbi:hypothetical protein [Streptomyces sp. NPDC091371]|uniref:hypothetical protein n=1 Tax=Streptomyces sp. NPDC091371 TaxID=3155303 RepID=UPI00341F1EF6